MNNTMTGRMPFSLRFTALAIINFFLWQAVLLSSTENPLVGLNFVVLSSAETIPEVELKLSGDRSKTVRVSATEFSEEVRVPMMDFWVVGHPLDEPSAVSDFNELGRVAALDSLSQIILIVECQLPGEKKYHLFALDSEEENFGPGMFAIVNATNVAIGGEIGRKKFLSKPNETSFVRAKEFIQERTVNVLLSYEKNGTMKTYSNTRWPYNESARSIICVVRNSRGKLALKAITDYK